MSARNSDEQGDNAEAVSEDAGAPAVAVAVALPDNEPQANAEADAEATALAGRIAALETRITAAIEGERSWTQETINPLRQELADLRSTLTEAATSLPAQISTLREELTRLSQELQAAIAAQAAPQVPVVEAPEVPPTAELPAADGAVQVTQSEVSATMIPAKRARRVI